MSEPKPKKPNMAPFYGAAFGFITDRLVKPVHFATGFFVSVLGRQYKAELLNNVVAFADGKDPNGNYELSTLHQVLRAKEKLQAHIGQSGLHILRRQLRGIAGNDGALGAIYCKKPSYGCDYTTASHQVLTRFSDNDGFSGYFVYRIMQSTEGGRKILGFATEWITQSNSPLHQVYQPLIEDEPEDYEMERRYTDKFGELTETRAKHVAARMAGQTAAVVALCRNVENLAASETRLRCLISALCLWLFRYLIEEGVATRDESFVILADTCGESSSRMREQSRWSYARLREALVGSFAAFADRGRFDECEEAWDYIKTELNGRPKFEDLYRTIALRSGLAQPRASRVLAKHFEPQPDTLRILVWSVLPKDETMLPLTALLERLHSTWGLVYGGRPDDARLLVDLGYTGLDQDQDLAPNVDALINLLAELGLATRFSDGLVMCHSEPRFS